MRGHCPEIPIGLLLANPFQKWLQLWSGAKQFQISVLRGKLRVSKGCVNLLVARFAKRHAVIRLPTFLPGKQVMQRDQLARHDPATQQADAAFLVRRPDHGPILGQTRVLFQRVAPVPSAVAGDHFKG